MSRLGIWKEFDKTSQSYKIRKYCKNIGMQKLTFEECSISRQSTDLVHFYCMNLSLILCQKSTLYFDFENVSKWVKIALQNLCKNSIPLPSHMQKKVVREKKWLKQKL